MKTIVMMMAALVALSSPLAQAVEASLAQQVESRLTAALGSRLAVQEVTALANEQLLEVTLVDGSIMHMTPDMNFFLYRDELYQLTGSQPVNVTQTRRNPMRAAAIKSVPDEQTVVFPAKGKEKTVINVFTDIDCGYCQKLHQEVPRLNELGITVRYLAYPRAGIKDNNGGLTASYRKINYVWCAGDRASAMTEIKALQSDLNMAARTQTKNVSTLEKRMASLMAQTNDCGAPIAAQYELGYELGVGGTPSIFLQDGTLIPGYMPANDLARRIGLL